MSDKTREHKRGFASRASQWLREREASIRLAEIDEEIAMLTHERREILRRLGDPA